MCHARRAGHHRPRCQIRRRLHPGRIATTSVSGFPFPAPLHPAGNGNGKRPAPLNFPAQRPIRKRDDAHPSLILGPAIDEAAENEGRAEGAFIFYCQSAEDLVGLIPMSSLPVVEAYEVPVKRRGDPSSIDQSQVFKTHVINPLLTLQQVAGFLKIEERRTDRILYAMSKLTSQMLGSFDSDRTDVVQKRQHTGQFLNRAAGDLVVRIDRRFGEKLEELRHKKNEPGG